MSKKVILTAEQVEQLKTGICPKCGGVIEIFFTAEGAVSFMYNDDDCIWQIYEPDFWYIPDAVVCLNLACDAEYSVDDIGVKKIYAEDVNDGLWTDRIMDELNDVK